MRDGYWHSGKDGISILGSNGETLHGPTGEKEAHQWALDNGIRLWNMPNAEDPRSPCE